MRQMRSTFIEHPIMLPLHHYMNAVITHQNSKRAGNRTDEEYIRFSNYVKYVWVDKRFYWAGFIKR